MDRAELFDLRVRVSMKWAGWFKRDELSPKQWPNHLLGYNVMDDISLGYNVMDDISDDHIRWLQRLDGPHGYTFAKALLAREGAS